MTYQEIIGRERPEPHRALKIASTTWEAIRHVGMGATTTFSNGASAHAFYENRQDHGKVPANVIFKPALKFVCLVPRPDSVSPKQFHERWLEHHSQLVRSCAAALRIKRYVQSHVIASPTIDSFGKGREWTPNPYSGMTECWFESEEDMAAGLASPEGQRASQILAEGERTVTDKGVILWAAREYEIF